jgi:SAM-dependent methyltransferase
MDKNYWNEKYWVRHMQNDDINNIEYPWINKYEGLIFKKAGALLDLGCGIGQYSKYFADNGFTVTAADISERALSKLSEASDNIKTVKLDMTEPLPFSDNEFDIVFANLSIHFFSKFETEALMLEIKRILKNGGLFIGSCNSSAAYKYIADSSTVIEEGFYLEDGGRSVRLFDRKQFEYFFADFENIVLTETETVRFNKSKNMWEFIYKNIK